MQVSQRYLAQLTDVAPEHPLVRQLKTKEEEFDQLSARFSVGS